MNVLRAVCLATTGAVAVSFSVAEAQENFFKRDRHTSVQERQQPEFDPEPIRLGALLVDSSLGVGVNQNDNIFAEDTAEQSDTIFVIEPAVQARTNWSQHQLSGGVAVQHREFADIGSESSTDIRSNLRGRLDVSRFFTFSADVRADSLNEARSAAASQGGAVEPVSYDVLDGKVEASFQSGRMAARTTVAFSEYDYDDVALGVTGLISDQDFRDHTRSSVQTRLSYALSPDVAVFGQAEVGARNFDSTFDVLGNEINRDATTYALQGGLDFELQALIRGDVAVGWLKDKKDGIGFGDITGLALDGQIEWFPTQLTTVTLTGSRRTIDPGLIDSPGAVTTGFGARVDHELRRNVVLYATARTSGTKFEDIARDDTITDFGLGGIYKLNKHVHANAFFRHLNRDSDIAVVEFGQNIFGIRLVFYP